LLNHTEVVQGVSLLTRWWIGQRLNKLREHFTETMTVNPFMLPFLFEFHNLKDFDALADLTLASHLMIRHNTGFGKFIDEKILPSVFKTHKLSKKYRNATIPFKESCFDEINHFIIRPDGKRELLSLKASKWTIQLTI